MKKFRLSLTLLFILGLILYFTSWYFSFTVNYIDYCFIDRTIELINFAKCLIGIILMVVSILLIAWLGGNNEN